jgi:nitroreductase
MSVSEAPIRPDLADTLVEVIAARQTVLPKRLVEPGPSPRQWQALLNAAAAAPDHDQLLPWRLVLIEVGQRAELGELFAHALQERDSQATPDDLAQAREKALRAPWLALLVVDAGKGDPAIDLLERVISAGCAVQNMLLLATAMGLGSALTSGKALKSRVFRQGLGLTETEHAICFISMGSVSQHKARKLRPQVDHFLSTWRGHHDR